MDADLDYSLVLEDEFDALYVLPPLFRWAAYGAGPWLTL